MSFIKFAPSALDKMRIEENKQLRKQTKEIREKARAKKIMIKKKAIEAKAKIQESLL
jgi:hypothetical protein